MRPVGIEESLQKSALFRGVSLESVRALLESASVRELAPGAVLIEPEKVNEELYILLEGRLFVHLGSLQNPPVRTGEPGECYGELSLIDGGKPSAWVVADAAVSVLAIPKDLLWTLVDSSHGVARNLLLILSGRVRHSNQAILAGLEKQQIYERAASVDALTGLHNRRWLDEFFERQVRRSQRDEKPATILMMDIDRFKPINDQFGHQVGDLVLAAVARSILTSLRPSDLVARYGGEEFAALLPDTTLEEACGVAERLRQSVERLVIRIDGSPLAPVTISIGVAILGREQSHEDLIKAADQALYRAKQEGRNRFVIAK